MRERTIKKVISVLMVFMMALTILPYMTREAQASGSYGQVTGSTPKVEGSFDFTLAINGNSTGVFVDSGDAVAGTKAALTTAGTTIKFADGFVYKGTNYDVYIKVTPDVDLASTAWACAGGSSYITLSPNTKSGVDSKFTYEIWLQSGDARVTSINMVAGSCFTAASEGARPYSDNGTIYTTIPSSAIEWNAEYSAYSPTSASYDQSSIYILGHGASADGSIKGGYVRTSGSGGCEIVWGYLTEITFKNEDNAPAGALSTTAQNIDVSGATAISAPTTNPNAGHYFSHWTIVDSNGNPISVDTTTGTFEAGKELTTAELETVKANKEFTVVAHYKDYSAETTSTDKSDTTKEDEFVLKKDGKTIASVDIEAKDMVYSGSPYTADSNVSITDLSDDKVAELIQAGYITSKEDLATAKVRYYVANDGDTQPTTLTNGENSGSDSEGGLPVEVGKYFAVLIFGSGDSAKQIYTTFNITPDEKSMVKAEDYEGAYDGKAHTINVTVPDGATVTYSETEDGTYSETAPTYTDVTSGAKTVYYKVTLSNGEVVTGSATVTITAADATTEDSTDATTEDSTDATTEDNTDATTEDSTDATTEDSTDAITEDSTDATTEDGTDATTEDGTDATTEDGTDATTEDGTDATTEDGTDATTEDGTDDVTEDDTEDVTDDETDDTEDVTDDETDATTEDGEDVIDDDDDESTEDVDEDSTDDADDTQDSGTEDSEAVDESDDTTATDGTAGSTTGVSTDGSTTATVTNSKAVQTGDAAAPLVIFGIGVFALLGAAGIITYRHRK